MRISVHCLSGIRGAEPRVFQIGGSRLRVVEILDCWRGPLHCYYKVSTLDGRCFVLGCESATGHWELVRVSRPGKSQPRGRLFLRLRKQERRASDRVRRTTLPIEASARPE
jgi:hypothetical protein